MNDETSTSHRDLLAWQEAMALVEVVYRETAGFPQREMYGLTAQIRRAVISIPSNMAEGAARNSPKELLQFLGISCGSFAELETQLERAVRLGYLDPAAASLPQMNHVGRLLTALRTSLKRTDA